MNGTEIRRLREARGLTQQDLAAAIGVGLRTIGNWERGETVPQNRMGMLEAFFGLDGPVDSPDPIRTAPDVELLAELLRRAAARSSGVG
jgi:transcriptional regulator with XRE-family HTH domain